MQSAIKKRGSGAVTLAPDSAGLELAVRCVS